VTGSNIPADAEEFGEHIDPDFGEPQSPLRVLAVTKSQSAGMNCGSCIPELKQLLQSAFTRTQLCPVGSPVHANAGPAQRS
jgi:hypothetical protein